MNDQPNIAWFGSDQWPDVPDGGAYYAVDEEGRRGQLYTWYDDAPGYYVNNKDGVGLDGQGEPHPDGLQAGAGHFEPYNGDMEDYEPRREA